MCIAVRLVIDHHNAAAFLLLSYELVEKGNEQNNKTEMKQKQN